MIRWVFNKSILIVTCTELMGVSACVNIHANWLTVCIGGRFPDLSGVAHIQPPPASHPEQILSLKYIGFHSVGHFAIAGPKGTGKQQPLFAISTSLRIKHIFRTLLRPTRIYRTENRKDIYRHRPTIGAFKNLEQKPPKNNREQNFLRRINF